MDLSYANQQIDAITSSYEKLVDFYCELQDENPLYIDDVEKLKDMHSAVTKSIDDYFVYLQKQGIPPENSYMTYWLKNDVLYDSYENEICYFLHNTLGIQH